MPMLIDADTHHQEFVQFVADYEAAGRQRTIEKATGALEFSTAFPGLYLEPSFSDAVALVNNSSTGALPDVNRTITLTFEPTSSAFSVGWNKDASNKILNLDAQEIVERVNLQQYGASVTQAKIFALFHEMGHSAQNAEEDFFNHMVASNVPNAGVFNQILSFYSLNKIDNASSDDPVVPEMHSLKRTVQESYGDVYAATLIAQLYPKNVAHKIVESVVSMREDIQKTATNHSYDTIGPLKQYLSDGLPVFTNFNERHAYISHVVIPAAVDTINRQPTFSPEFVGLLTGYILRNRDPNSVVNYENIFNPTVVGGEAHQVYTTPQDLLDDLTQSFPMFHWHPSDVIPFVALNTNEESNFLDALALAPLLAARKQVRSLAPEKSVEASAASDHPTGFAQKIAEKRSAPAPQNPRP